MLRPRRLRSRVPASHQNRASASIWSPQNPESMPQDSLAHTQLGIPDSTPPESALTQKYWRQSAKCAGWICPSADLSRPSQKSETGLIAAFPAAFEASHALACTKQVD